MSRPDDVNGSNDIIVRMENDELVFEKLLPFIKTCTARTFDFSWVKNPMVRRGFGISSPPLQSWRKGRGLFSSSTNWIEACIPSCRNGFWNTFWTYAMPTAAISSFSLRTTSTSWRRTFSVVTNCGESTKTLIALPFFIHSGTSKKSEAIETFVKVYLNGLMGAVPTILWILEFKHG